MAIDRTYAIVRCHPASIPNVGHHLCMILSIIGGMIAHLALYSACASVARLFEQAVTSSLENKFYS